MKNSSVHPFPLYDSTSACVVLPLRGKATVVEPEFREFTAADCVSCVVAKTDGFV